MQRKCHRCDRLFTQDTVCSAERNFTLTNEIKYSVGIGCAKINNGKENKDEDTKHWIWG